MNQLDHWNPGTQVMAFMEVWFKAGNPSSCRMSPT